MDVFISYSRKDYLNADDTVNENSIVAQLLRRLDDESISYWIDKEGIYEKDNFAELIAQKIIDSKVFLFVSTKNSNQSQWTSKEVAVAHEYEKQIVPFRIDDSKFAPSVTFYLADIDQISYYKNPAIGLDLLLKSVKEKINALTNAEDKEERLLQLKGRIQSLTETNTLTNTEIIKLESSLEGLIHAYNSNLEQIASLKQEINSLNGKDKKEDISKDYKESLVEKNKSLATELDAEKKQIEQLNQKISKLQANKSTLIQGLQSDDNNSAAKRRNLGLLISGSIVLVAVNIVHAIFSYSYYALSSNNTPIVFLCISGVLCVSGICAWKKKPSYFFLSIFANILCVLASAIAIMI